MRPNDKILLENIGDYFNYKGLSPNMIDDIKENLREDQSTLPDNKWNKEDSRTIQILLALKSKIAI